MNAIIGLVLAIRFLLEVSTILGLISGFFLKQRLLLKILFLFLGIALVLVWTRYGAPRSPNVLIGLNKLFLEIVVYAVGIIGFYSIFGFQIGTVYTAVVIIDLALMYALRLQGH